MPSALRYRRCYPSYPLPSIHIPLYHLLSLCASVLRSSVVARKSFWKAIGVNMWRLILSLLSVLLALSRASSFHDNPEQDPLPPSPDAVEDLLKKWDHEVVL